MVFIFSLFWDLFLSHYLVKALDKERGKDDYDVGISEGKTTCFCLLFNDIFLP